MGCRCERFTGGGGRWGRIRDGEGSTSRKTRDRDRIGLSGDRLGICVYASRYSGKLSARQGKADRLLQVVIDMGWAQRGLQLMVSRLQSAVCMGNLK